MITVVQIKNKNTKNAKKALLTTYKGIVLARVFIFFMLRLALFLISC